MIGTVIRAKKKSHRRNLHSRQGIESLACRGAGGELNDQPKKKVNHGSNERTGSRGGLILFGVRKKRKAPSFFFLVLQRKRASGGKGRPER